MACANAVSILHTRSVSQTYVVTIQQTCGGEHQKRICTIKCDNFL